MKARSIAVVGVQYPNADKSNRRFEIMICNPGEPVELRLEPKNKYDPYAVAVFSHRGIQIGYIPADQALFIGGVIRSGRELSAIFQSASELGAIVRLGFDGEIPSVPSVEITPHRRRSPPSASGSDDGFWPDYIPPDD